METLAQTAFKLRNAAVENIENYCKKTGENYTEVYNYYVRKADEYNLKLPIDFYTDLYNLTLELCEK